MHASGRAAAEALRAARERVARCFSATTEEVIFTGSGTESDNLALFGAARAHAKHGKHIIVSAIEHKAVLESAEALAREGYEITVAPVDVHGMVDVAKVVSLVRDDTTLISIMLANNEIGTIEPITELVCALEVRRERTGFPLIHTDACQAAGHLALDVTKLGVDLMTVNGSKVYGPRGVGVLYKKRSVRISPLIIGGGQEYALRAGTESVPVIVGLALALEKAEKLRESEHARLSCLRQYFIGGLRALIPDIIVNGHPHFVLPHIVHVTVPSIEGESMVLMLDEKGVAAATGSACSSRDLKPSHVLSAIGQNGDLIHGSVRFSLGRSTRQDDLDYVLSVFPAVVATLKKTSILTSQWYAKEKYSV
jgi:cysteine desulfurase